jgi:hypothetical protein
VSVAKKIAHRAEAVKGAAKVTVGVTGLLYQGGNA